MLALGRLLRISLLPSALADITVGLVLGADGGWPTGAAPIYLLLSSLGIYHGALALNDWVDREQDALDRPERPVPSGAIAPGTALAIAGLAIGAGVLAAFGAGVRAGIWMSVVAALAVAYDLRGRGPLLGPLLLGLCRFGNLGAGLLLATWSTGAAVEPERLAPALLYGVYVFVVSRLGRLEDREDPRPLADRPARALWAAALALALVPALGLVVPGATGPGAALAAMLAWGGAVGLVQAARREDPWTRAAVGASMGLALRRLLVFTAACALLLAPTSGAARVAVAVALGGYPLSFALRRVFPPS